MHRVGVSRRVTWLAYYVLSHLSTPFHIMYWEFDANYQKYHRWIICEQQGCPATLTNNTKFHIMLNFMLLKITDVLLRNMLTQHSSNIHVNHCLMCDADGHWSVLQFLLHDPLLCTKWLYWVILYTSGVITISVGFWDKKKWQVWVLLHHTTLAGLSELNDSILYQCMGSVWFIRVYDEMIILILTYI